ncbi:MAG: tyrosine-type recombinase/integrase [Pseudonocardiaceae bacterium]
MATVSFSAGSFDNHHYHSKPLPLAIATSGDSAGPGPLVLSLSQEQRGGRGWRGHGTRRAGRQHRDFLADLARQGRSVHTLRAYRGDLAAFARNFAGTRDRDRLLFRLIYTTGMRIGEALSIEIDDLDLTRDDEHVTILGKGGRRRTVLLDDPSVVAMLRRYLRARGYRHGPLFRAEKTTWVARCATPPPEPCGPNTGRKLR